LWLTTRRIYLAQGSQLSYPKPAFSHPLNQA
jgi:hypothetical protein